MAMAVRRERMRRRDQVITLLKAHESELRARGVEGLFLFGSLGRGAERAGSDVDLFFDHCSGLGLEVIGIQERLREIVPGEVDVTTRCSLHPLLRERIVAEAVRVF
jgi:predicted nucleotidyltransferase